MKSIYTRLVILGMLLITFTAVQSCADKSDKIEETPVQGEATILVDETVFPVVEDLQRVFESIYVKAKINLVAKSENEILVELEKNNAQIAILARDLTSNEISAYKSKQVIPVRTLVGTDALAFVMNKQATDTLISTKELTDILTQNGASKKTLYFDNANSSTVKKLLEVTGVKELPKIGVYASKSNEEVLDKLSESNLSIGVVGVNWLQQPTPKIADKVKKLKVLGFQTANGLVKPNQTNIADKSYPYTRNIYIINAQGRDGLGIGFASYIAGAEGQRVILKSGLVPAIMPYREINIIK